jgi:hypothetical protein
MNQPESLPEPLLNLIDDYLDGLLDEARTAELEDLLLADSAARDYFVRYARLHTDLYMRERARQASQRVLQRIEQLSVSGGETLADLPESQDAAPMPVACRAKVRPWAVLAAACVLLLALGLGWWLAPRVPTGNQTQAATIAWLVNAQNCQWADELDAAANMQAGKVLKLTSGLAEIHFQCGARIVLEGPASLELLSARSARLQQGKLTARVAKEAAGFVILSPQGKVIDLGTEFGISVAADGATKVRVFEGKVEAQAAHDAVSLSANQTASLWDGKVTFDASEPAQQAGFVRAIVPPPVIVPQTRTLTFRRAQPDSLQDSLGLGTGFTHRLPGTGRRVPQQDPNLRLDAPLAQLELTTTRSDINNQVRLSLGEYLGVRLADLGFTGQEDFAVMAKIANTPDLEDYGQFGLYAGTRSDRNIRGGLIKWGPKDAGLNTQFMVNNHGGRDTDVYKVGLLSPGTDLQLTLQRIGGKYSLAVENLTEGGVSTLTIRHPDFLDGETDLYVGLFGANPYSDVRKTIVVKEFSATVWTLASPK